MEAYEVPVKLTTNGGVEFLGDLPASLASLSCETIARAIILIPCEAESKERTAWSKLTTQQFVKGYSESDSIYDRI